MVKKKFKIETIFGADDNFVVMQVNQDNQHFIVNVEQFIDESDIIENYFNVNDIVIGQLAIEEIKREISNLNDFFLEQNIYKFSSFSRMGCRIEKRLDENKYLAKTIDDIEIVLLTKSENNYNIGKYYIIEGYLWILND